MILAIAIVSRKSPNSMGITCGFPCKWLPKATKLDIQRFKMKGDQVPSADTGGAIDNNSLVHKIFPLKMDVWPSVRHAKDAHQLMGKYSEMPHSWRLHCTLLCVAGQWTNVDPGNPPLVKRFSPGNGICNISSIILDPVVIKKPIPQDVSVLKWKSFLKWKMNIKHFSKNIKKHQSPVFQDRFLKKLRPCPAFAAATAAALLGLAPQGFRADAPDGWCFLGPKNWGNSIEKNNRVSSWTTSKVFSLPNLDRIEERSHAVAADGGPSSTALMPSINAKNGLRPGKGIDRGGVHRRNRTGFAMSDGGMSATWAGSLWVRSYQTSFGNDMKRRHDLRPRNARSSALDLTKTMADFVLSTELVDVHRDIGGRSPYR